LLGDLHKQFGARIELLIFPSDEFGAQELPDNQIAPFCESKGVPTNVPGCHLMAKVQVKEPNANPIWQLAKSSFPGEVKWNFDGIFLFDKSGSVVSRHSIRVPPTLDQISALL